MGLPTVPPRAPTVIDTASRVAWPLANHLFSRVMVMAEEKKAAHIPTNRAPK